MLANCKLLERHKGHYPPQALREEVLSFCYNHCGTSQEAAVVAKHPNTTYGCKAIINSC